MIVALLFNNFSIFAYAANDYNHAELLEYEGYGQAMYESIVEQTTYISGQYTDNKEYVTQSIDEIKSYADFWKNDFNNWDQSCNNDFTGCMRGMLEGTGGLVLTVGDFIKNLFSDYEETFLSTPPVIDSEFYHHDGHSRYTLRNGLVFSSNLKELDGQYAVNFGAWKQSASARNLIISINSYDIEIPYDNASESQTKMQEIRDVLPIGNLSSVLAVLNSVSGVSVSIRNGEGEAFPGGDGGNPNISSINNYIKDNPVQIPMPQLAPTLVCPDGTKIKMGISGSTFIAVNGETMLVNKDGTAEVNGEICNLNWEKPTVKYDPEGNVITTQPDGTTDTTDKVPGFTDLEGCDGGVFCAIAKLLDGLGSIVKAITGLVGKILDGILALFVPDDLSFLSTEFKRITDKLNEKIAITGTIKEMITSVFDGGSSNPLQDISINLPITNEPLSFGNVSFIEEGVPILRKAISGICILYTLLYVYRKITGRGGVMEK